MRRKGFICDSSIVGRFRRFIVPVVALLVSALPLGLPAPESRAEMTCMDDVCIEIDAPPSAWRILVTKEEKVRSPGFIVTLLEAPAERIQVRVFLVAESIGSGRRWKFIRSLPVKEKSTRYTPTADDLSQWPERERNLPSFRLGAAIALDHPTGFSKKFAISWKGESE